MYAENCYTMRGQLAVGLAAETFLDGVFCRWYHILHVSGKADRAGVDRLFYCRENIPADLCQCWDGCTIQYKCDRQAWRTGNMFLELVSVDCRNVPGWIYTTAADILMYYVWGPGLVYSVYLEDLRAMLPVWCARYSRAESGINDNDWRARGLLVPLTELQQLVIDGKAPYRLPVQPADHGLYMQQLQQYRQRRNLSTRVDRFYSYSN